MPLSQSDHHKPLFFSPRSKLLDPIYWILAMLPSGFGQADSPLKEEGIPSYIIYSPEMIRLPQGMKNLSFDQLGRLIGISGDDLILYDGQSWTSIHSGNSGSPSGIRNLTTGFGNQIILSHSGAPQRLSVTESGKYELAPVGDAKHFKRWTDNSIQGIRNLRNELYVYSKNRIVSISESGLTETWPTLNLIYSLFEYDGDVYAADFHEGVFRLDNNSFRRQKSSINLSNSNTIIASAKLTDRRLILATLDNGLLAFDGKDFSKWNTDIERYGLGKVIGLIPISGYRKQGHILFRPSRRSPPIARHKPRQATQQSRRNPTFARRRNLGHPRHIAHSRNLPIEYQLPIATGRCSTKRLRPTTTQGNAMASERWKTIPGLPNRSRSFAENESIHRPEYRTRQQPHIH